jgi:hypothetical protein
VLSFRPPWWYFASVWPAASGWIGVLGLLVADRLSILPERWRRRSPVAPDQRMALSQPTSGSANKSPAGRVIVIIPTYNEASGILSVLD